MIDLLISLAMATAEPMYYIRDERVIYHCPCIKLPGYKYYCQINKDKDQWELVPDSQIEKTKELAINHSACNLLRDIKRKEAIFNWGESIYHQFDPEYTRIEVIDVYK